MQKFEMETTEIIRLASEAGAKAALATLESEKKRSVKEWHDKRLFNTKLLLKNYRMLNNAKSPDLLLQQPVTFSPLSIPVRKVPSLSLF